MTEEKETTATMWQDNHSGKRGHQLMTKKLADTIPAIGANENACNYSRVLWRFTSKDARIRLKSLYPSMQQ